MKTLSKFLFWLSGWKTIGQVPDLKKFVAIYAPHTSGWDLIIGICAKFIFDLRISLLAKKELFNFPLGPILRSVGAIPVDRSSSHNLVDQVVAMFNERDNFILALSPEGTREYAPKWKTGFYYIALKAQVPIVFTYIDFERKVVGFGPTFIPTGDADKDIETIKQFYRPVKGRHPEKGVR
jgi:1-acyl-sn-glycerol-3-phosphate acyltransferase